MAITFNYNSGLVLGAAAPNSNRNFMDSPSERQASGKRINSAADDAAGIAVLSKLEAALSEKERAIRNAADAEAAMTTADAGAAEVSNILNRMRELAVQATNGTNSIAQREAIKSEADQLSAELNRIVDNTSLNNKNLLTDGQIDIQTGSSSGEQVTIKFGELTSELLNHDGGAVSFNTVENARASIQSIDTALEKVNLTRSEIGAGVNRISYAISHLSDATKSSEITAGRVSDSDIGEESSNFAKAQILQQSSIAMLAQGNASNRAILQLMQR